MNIDWLVADKLTHDIKTCRSTNKKFDGGLLKGNATTLDLIVSDID